MNDGPPGSGAGQVGGGVQVGVSPLDETTRTTYRYLRVSVVVLAALLVVSIALELLWGEGERFGTISGFYYSPVQNVLVGALVALGPALIAIRGRFGWEDSLLDWAGMLIPVVALVPTPREMPAGVCGEGRLRCVPPDLEPAVTNNVATLLVVGVLGLAFAWRSRGSLGSDGRPRTGLTRRGLVVATAAFVVFAVWFLALRDLFLLGAHYVCAVLFFLLIAVVAYLNGRRVTGRSHVRLMSPRRYSTSYKAISALMIATIALTAGAQLVAAVAGGELPAGTIFVVEAVLLVLFLVFWVLQTAENWAEEAVEDTTAPSVVR